MIGLARMLGPTPPVEQSHGMVAVGEDVMYVEYELVPVPRDGREEAGEDIVPAVVVATDPSARWLVLFYVVSDDLR